MYSLTTNNMIIHKWSPCYCCFLLLLWRRALQYGRCKSCNEAFVSRCIISLNVSAELNYLCPFSVVQSLRLDIWCCVYMSYTRGHHYKAQQFSNQKTMLEILYQNKSGQSWHWSVKIDKSFADISLRSLYKMQVCNMCLRGYCSGTCIGLLVQHLVAMSIESAVSGL